MHPAEHLVAAELSWPIHANSRVRIDRRENLRRHHLKALVGFERRRSTWPRAPFRELQRDRGRDHVGDSLLVLEQRRPQHGRVLDLLDPVPAEVVGAHVQTYS